MSNSGGTLQLRLDKPDGPAIAETKIPKGTEWKIIKASLTSFKPGVHNLIVSLKDNSDVEVDWISFE
jgi:hypothetical protein